MAEIPFRVNLNAAEIPFLTSLLGRTVIVPGLDQNSVKSAQFAGSGESLDQGIPQILYAHNVVPTDFGVQSVGFTKVIAKAASTTGRIFDQVFTLRDVNENAYLFSPAGGDCWVYDATYDQWRSNFQLSPAFTGRFVSKSSINGRTFICFEKRGFFEYFPGTGSLVEVEFAGLVKEEIIGITNSGNYGIAYTVDLILWSSLVDETDYVPDLSTGAGSATPQDLKGPIVCVLPISGGMIVYTTRNVVVGLATNNARFPFNFKEISNGGGLDNAEHASFENGLGTHYAWTSAGLQKITTTAAETVFPAATDFLAGRLIEDFDESTAAFTSYKLTDDIRLKLTYLESRYLIISYGARIGSNLLSWSETLTQQLPWIPQLVTAVEAPGIEDPFGTDLATALTYTGAFNGTTGEPIYLDQIVDTLVPTGQTYTLSVWARSDVAQQLKLILSDSGFAEVYEQLFQLTPIWQRLTLTATFSAAVLSGVRSSITLHLPTVSTEIKCHVFGAQLEQAAAASRYVKTTSGSKPDGSTKTYDFALLFDSVLKRWGKLKLNHTDCFAYTYPSVGGGLPYREWTGSYSSWQGISYSQLRQQGAITPIPKKSIGFLRDDGSVYVVNFEFDAVTRAALLLGKYQLTRTSVSTLQKVEVENPNVQATYSWNPSDANTEADRLAATVANEEVFRLRLLPSYDGRNFGPAVVPTLLHAADDLLIYGFNHVAISHTLYISGSFHLRTIINTLTKHGKR